ncbi:MAG: FAD-dependent oxidoreductase [Tannerella sp.]|jgi:NADPH-dependent 2,4-dienoyl-CoA reductase/sulfur reductase-like enzyme|nr:FAD-dependent oxidoreductase [Tannerella sp.]
MLTRRSFIKTAAAGSALTAFGQYSAARSAVNAVTVNDTTTFVLEGERRIPVIADVDIAIVGGSSAAVAAAAAAARAGCTVFLAAPMPYLGEDICGTFRFVPNKDEQPDLPLSRKLFGQSKNPTPLYIKTELENELIDNDVRFLYSSYLTNIIKDTSGAVAGIVITNRSGRQAICSRAVIDATNTAVAARAAAAEFTVFKPGKYDFSFVTVGSKAQSIVGAIAEDVPYTLNYRNKTLPVTRYTFNLDISKDSYSAIQEAEQIIRDKTWTPDQSDSSDCLEYVPLTQIIPQQEYRQSATLIRDIPFEALLPKSIDNLVVLSASAGLSHEAASKILHPVNAVALGQMAGEKIADIINRKQKTNNATIIFGAITKGDNIGEIRELTAPLRPDGLTSGREIPTQTETALPVLGQYDVIVLGGGTAGAPAGISAARHGAKTLMLEYLHGLGGLMTLGLIGRYWDGYRGGFSAEADEGVRNMAPSDHPRQLKNWKDDHHSDWKQEYFRREYRKAGGELWFGVIGSGALVKDNVVKGVVVTTPYGRGVVLGKIIIDSTGSADTAIAAGADYNYTGKHVAVQGAGMGFWAPEDYYNNNDWAFIDDTDMLDVSRIYVQAKKKLAGKYDMVKLPQTRERRRIAAQYNVSVYDVIGKRRYNDTISYHKSSFDTHGMIVDPYFILLPPEKRHAIYDADVPLRALLPKGLTNIMVTGLGAGADRDAMPVIRMQSCLQCQGFAVGYLAATAVKEGKTVTKVDIRKVQKYLVSIGNLPDRILTEKPFKGYSDNEYATAARSVRDNYKGLEILLTDTDKCKHYVNKEILTATSDSDRVIYASILCILGDKTYAKVLADEIQRHDKWDVGWNYTGMGQFGPCMSRLDALIIALGKSRDATYLPTVLQKAQLLNRENTFSHFRAVSIAAEEMRSPDAASLLYDKLTAPGMRNHHIADYRDARRKTVPDVNDTSTRNDALKELHLARALYFCGDKSALGETILRNYASGLQAHYSNYARYALDNNKPLQRF